MLSFQPPPSMGQDTVNPEPPEPTGCSFYSTSQISIDTLEGHFCNFCYEICKKAQIPLIKAHFSVEIKCSCEHDGFLIINFFYFSEQNLFFR